MLSTATQRQPNFPARVVRKLSARTGSGTSKQDPIDAVIAAFLDNEMGPTPGGRHVLAQIDEIDLLPDLLGEGGEFVF